MRRALPFGLLALCLLVARPSSAQIHGHSHLNHAVGFGVGLDRTGGQGLFYLTGNYRFNFWDEETEDIDTIIRSRGRSRMKSFLEAEIGYWNDSELIPYKSDLNIGVNVIGVLPTRAVDVFFGGGVGVHFIGASDLLPETESIGSETRFGANVQFGADMNLSDSLAIFALGRYDLLQVV